MFFCSIFLPLLLCFSPEMERTSPSLHLNRRRDRFFLPLPPPFPLVFPTSCFFLFSFTQGGIVMVELAANLFRCIHPRPPSPLHLSGELLSPQVSDFLQLDNLCGLRFKKDSNFFHDETRFASFSPLPF